MGLPDLGGIIGQVTNMLPPAGHRRHQGHRRAPSSIPKTPASTSAIPQPPGERPIPVEPGSKELTGAVKAIDAGLGALNVLTKLNFLIPDLRGAGTRLTGALQTVRGWLD